MELGGAAGVIATEALDAAWKVSLMWASEDAKVEAAPLSRQRLLSLIFGRVILDLTEMGALVPEKVDVMRLHRGIAGELGVSDDERQRSDDA